MTKIISTPQMQYWLDASWHNPKHHFGYFETINVRSSQEDALVFETFKQDMLIPKGATEPLSPRQIGHRLWTTYQLLDKDILMETDIVSGTTASTTIYDGQGNLITATLADAVSFAVIYDQQGDVLRVVRLNKVIHKPGNDEEYERITSAGGLVIEIDSVPRVDGELAVSRALGDPVYKKSGVCSDASIDITNLSQMVTELELNPAAVGSIQIITTCDGFTDGACEQTLAGHEYYLLYVLQNIASPGTLSEDKLSEALAYNAIADGSLDNVSVAIKTITQNTPPFMLGMFDGHGGKDAAVYVAEGIGDIFKAQCALTASDYARQKLSIHTKHLAYHRDNALTEHFIPEDCRQIIDLLPTSTMRKTTSELNWNPSYLQGMEIIEKLLSLTTEYQQSLNTESIEGAQIAPIVQHLLSLLNNTQFPVKERIQYFYAFLERDASEENIEDSENRLKNIDIIKKDTSKSTTYFLAGIALIVATALTVVVPGILIAGIVYKTTGKNPLDLFKSNSDIFTNNLDRIKEKNRSYAAFFPPQDPPTPEPNEIVLDEITRDSRPRQT